MEPTKKQLANTILNFLKDINRPYQFGEILEKCGKSEGKTAVQKALDSLVLREKILEKTFGKLKIYFAKQEDEPGLEDSEIATLEKKLEQLEKLLKEKQNEIKRYEAEVKTLSSKQSLAELEMQQDDLKIKVLSLTEKVSGLKSSQEMPLSGVNVKELTIRHENMLSEYRKRKRICNNMIDSIMEGYPKTKKQLIEEIGLETDEMANFSIKL